MRVEIHIRVCLCIAALLCGFWATPTHASEPEYLKDRYKNGDSHAAYIIGNRYRLGVGGEKNNDLAINWYEKAGRQGVIEAQFVLAWMATRSGENPDYEIALKWALMAEANLENENEAQQEAYVAAKKILKRMCRYGYVDFPKGHAYANDPKCWLKRGTYLYKNRTPTDEGTVNLSYSKSTGYSERTKTYLIKALDAGEHSAAEVLAKIETQGWGGEKNTKKAEQYLSIGKRDNKGRGLYKEAIQAKQSDDLDQYLYKLKLGAELNSERSAGLLGREYLDGVKVEKDEGLGIMYLILGRSRRPFQFTGKSSRHLDAYFPFIFDEPAVAVLFREKSTLKLLENSYEDALAFAAVNKFDSDAVEDVTETFEYAMSSYNYIHPRGAIWYNSHYWRMMFFMLAPFIALNVFGFFIWLLLRKDGARLRWLDW